MRRPALALALALGTTVALAPGCYLSHERGADGGAIRDARIEDAPARLDAPEIDGGPIECSSVRVAATVLLDEGVTPRVAALGGSDVGVVYVRTDGSPTRVIYERLDRALGRVTGPVTIATDSFTWAELASARGEIWIAYGLAGDGQSVLARATLAGAPLGRQAVPLYHPSIFQVAGEGFFWAAFAMRSDNALELSHLDAAGAATHPVVTIPLGRYGSGHGAIARDARSHVVTYPREGPPGRRHGHVNLLTAGGELGPERLLDPEASDDTVLPLRTSRGLVLVRRSDEALVLERLDPASLETTERFPHPAIGSRPIAGVVGDRVVVLHSAGGALAVDDFGTDLAHFERLREPIPAPSLGGSASVAELPGALVVAMMASAGGTSRPWLARIECAP